MKYLLFLSVLFCISIAGAQTLGSTSCFSWNQTLTNSWETNGVKFTQWSVTIINIAASSQTDISFSFDQTLTQFWNIAQSGSSFTLPAYQTSLQAGASFQFGYIIASESSASITILSPTSCASSSPSTSTTGSVSSTSSSTTGIPSTTTTGSSSSSCSFSVSLIATSNWTDGVSNYRQFSWSIVNTGSSVLVSVRLEIAYSFGNITQYWNMQRVVNAALFELNTFNLQPGQTSTASGFTWSITLQEWALLNTPAYGNDIAYAVPYGAWETQAFC